MTIYANFIGTPLTGESPLVVQYTDTSTGGTIISWFWSFGDTNTSIEQNPEHTYSSPGLYTVSLTVNGIVTETKINYIEVIEVPIIVIAKSESKDLDKYWKFSIDYEGHLIYETESIRYRSRDVVITRNNRWTFVEFHPLEDKMYIGDTRNYRQEIPVIKTLMEVHTIPGSNRLLVAPDSSITIDELKIYNKDIDLQTYFDLTRGIAASLK